MDRTMLKSRNTVAMLGINKINKRHSSHLMIKPDFWRCLVLKRPILDKSMVSAHPKGAVKFFM